MDIQSVWVVVALLPVLMHVYDRSGDAADRLGDWWDDDTEQTAVDEVHQRYLSDEIDEDELEDRLEILVDDRARTIRDLADDEHGIGDEISRKVAREFDTVGEFVAADVEDLKAIDDIGPERAETLARIDAEWGHGRRGRVPGSLPDGEHPTVSAVVTPPVSSVGVGRRDGDDLARQRAHSPVL